ncbi:MAG: hypothetical protein IVW55_12265 [Chloroflexi bacterium]|nr:hypothetical protein [Chloroflexota bacterium]
MSGRRVQQWISAYALMPSYAIFLLSMIVRGLAGVISTMTVAYVLWPFGLRLAIEVLAVLGILVCTEIINSASAASWAARRHDLAYIEASGDYTPSARLRGARLLEQTALLSSRKRVAIARCRREMRLQLGFSVFCGTVSAVYGVIFALNSATHVSLTTVATEIVLVVTAPPVVFYMSAIFSEEHDPMATGQAIAMHGLEARLALARTRIANDKHTNGDVAALGAALPDNPQLQRIVGLLRKEPDTVYRARDLYSVLGIRDASGQALIRRAVRRAGERGELGVTSEAGTGDWLIPASAVVPLLSSGVARGSVLGHGSSKTEQTPNKHRTPAEHSLAANPEFKGSPATPAEQYRTPAEHTPNSVPVTANS